MLEVRLEHPFTTDVELSTSAHSDLQPGIQSECLGA